MKGRHLRKGALEESVIVGREVRKGFLEEVTFQPGHEGDYKLTR